MPELNNSLDIIVILLMTTPHTLDCRIFIKNLEIGSLCFAFPKLFFVFPYDFQKQFFISKEESLLDFKLGLH